MKRIITPFLFISVFSLITLPAKSQIANLIDAPFITGTGFNAAVHAVALQPDQKILVGGTFVSFNGTTGLSRIARLNSDGNLDNTFSTEVFSGVSFPEINAIAIQADGKIIAGGDFAEYDGASQSAIIRLNTDGSHDATFNIGTGFDGYVTALAIQNDGKIIVAGNFDNYNDTLAGNIVRLHPNGVIDQSYLTGTGFNIDVDEIVLQDDGKLLVGGGFGSYNGTTSQWKLSRLNTDGTLDNTFNIGTGAAGSTRVSAIKVLSDGKIAIGGSFLMFNGQGAFGICRINSDGSGDNTFSPGPSGFNNSVWAIEELPNGKLLVGGLFEGYNGIDGEHLVILNEDGSRNFMFPQNFGMSHAVTTLLMQPDGKVIVGGIFTGFMPIATQAVGRIARVIVDEAASVNHLDPAEINLSIYPNPATNEVTLTINNGIETNDNIHLSIYDLQGRKVDQLEIKTPSTKVNTSNLNKGTYIVQLYNNGITHTEKFIIQ